MEQPDTAPAGHRAASIVDEDLVDALDTLHTVEYHLSPYGSAPHRRAHAHITVAIHAALAAQAAVGEGGGGR